MNLSASAPVCLRRLMNYLPAIQARYYGCEVWLVGSAQQDTNPRDIDIVIKIPEHLFFAMYGDENYPEETLDTWIKGMDSWDCTSNIWKMWSRDIAKQGRELTLFARRQVDFKTHPSLFFDAIEKQKTLLLPNFL